MKKKERIKVPYDGLPLLNATPEEVLEQRKKVYQLRKQIEEFARWSDYTHQYEQTHYLWCGEYITQSKANPNPHKDSVEYMKELRKEYYEQLDILWEMQRNHK